MDTKLRFSLYCFDGVECVMRCKKYVRIEKKRCDRLCFERIMAVPTPERYGSGRFFYPETRFFLRWHVTEPVDLLVNLRAFYPVFHLWDGSGQPFWDQLMVSFGIGFGIKLGSAPK